MNTGNWEVVRPPEGFNVVIICVLLSILKCHQERYVNFSVLVLMVNIQEIRDQDCQFDRCNLIFGVEGTHVSLQILLGVV